MKLLIVAALVAATSAGRLEHLERSYLPPDNSLQGNFGNNGFGSQNGFGNGGSGNRFPSGGSGAHGPGANGFASNGFGSNGHGTNGNGLGAHGSGPAHGSSGLGGSIGSNGFGSNGVAGGQGGAFPGATSNQYLPPNQRPAGSGSNGFHFGGSAINSGCSSCGSRPAQQYQGPHSSVPSTNYGVPQFGSTFGSPNGFGSGSSSGPAYRNPGSSFGPGGAHGSGSQGPASRQYLAPAVSQGGPQQPFDVNSGYIY